MKGDCRQSRTVLVNDLFDWGFEMNHSSDSGFFTFADAYLSVFFFFPLLLSLLGL